MKTFLGFEVSYSNDVRLILFILNKPRNSTTLRKLLISNLFVAPILHYCSLHRNAQYGLVPFRVLTLKIEDSPCKYKINSYIRVLVKWRPLADTVIVAPLADVFSSI